MDFTVYRSEIKDYIEITQRCIGTENEKAIEACDKIEEYGQKKNDIGLVAYANYSRGTIFYFKNKSQLAISHMHACIGPFIKLQEWGYVCQAYTILGIISLNRGNAPEAMDYYLKGINIAIENNMPSIEARFHMNIAALYLSINDCTKAISHLEDCYIYICQHTDYEDFLDNYTAVVIALGRANLNLSCVDDDMSGIYQDYLNRAIEYSNDLEKNCLLKVLDDYTLGILLFQARLYNRTGDIVKREEKIKDIGLISTNKLPILDLFDDLYEYLDMLLEIERYEEFFKLYDAMEDLIRKVNVKNLEKRLLTLKIRYYKQMKNIEEYQMAAVLYYEISELLERENRLAVSQMIEIRNSNSELTAYNTKVSKENLELHRRSETDPLTGIYNRFMLNDYSEKSFKKALDGQKPFAIEILDIDYFKQFNDNYGHQKGDECIKFIAQMLIKLRESLIGTDKNIFVSRYGGDEFVVIYEGLTEEETYAKAEELKDSIVERAMEHKYSLASDIVTISQGICWDNPKAGQNVWDYLHTADTMLYKVKEISRNSIKLGHSA